MYGFIRTVEIKQQEYKRIVVIITRTHNYDNQFDFLWPRIRFYFYQQRLIRLGLLILKLVKKLNLISNLRIQKHSKQITCLSRNQKICDSSFNKKYGKFTFFQYPHQQLWRHQDQYIFINNIRHLNLSNSLVQFKDKVQGNIQFFVIDDEKVVLRKFKPLSPNSYMMQTFVDNIFIYSNMNSKKKREIITYSHFNCKVSSLQIQRMRQNYNYSFSTDREIKYILKSRWRLVKKKNYISYVDKVGKFETKCNKSKLHAFDYDE